MAGPRSLALAPVPGLVLEVTGDEAGMRHLSAEYGAIPPSTAQDAGSVRLRLRFVEALPNPNLRDGYKTVRWSARVDWPGQGEMILTIALRGRPRWFGLSLVQGYLVEPALSLLAPSTGSVLLPAAAVVVGGSALLLVGRSGSGKSSLAIRALAAGLPLLGDDQVLLSEQGIGTRFPRRLRIYDDLASTAPVAIASLPARYRRGLALRRVLRWLTRGYVAPSLAVPVTAIPGHVPAPPSPLGRVVLLKRDGTANTVATRPVELAAVLEQCADVLADQRKRLLGRSASLDVRFNVEAVARRERQILTRALEDIPAAELTSPGTIGAAAAIAAVAHELGLP